jgi:hypothetical protein
MATLNEKTLLPIGIVFGGIVALVPVVFALGVKDAKQEQLAARVLQLEGDTKDDRKAVGMQLDQIQRSVHELQWSVEQLRVDKKSP